MQPITYNQNQQFIKNLKMINRYSSLSAGNQALREGRFHEAIEFYMDAARQYPEFLKSIEFNLDYAKTKIANHQDITNSSVVKSININNLFNLGMQVKTAYTSSIEDVNFRRKSDTAVFVHSSHLDLMNELFEYMTNLGPHDLYVTVPFEMGLAHRKLIKEIKPDAVVVEFERRGRDVAPFFEIYRRISNLGYRYLLKIHTKKSPHRPDGHLWRVDTLNKLLGSAERVRLCKELIDAHGGLLIPEGYAYPIDGKNKSNSKNIAFFAERLGYEKDYGALRFPVGLMFWCSPTALEGINSIDINWKDFEREKGQLDGTLAHAFERAISLIVDKYGHAINEIPVKHSDHALVTAQRNNVKFSLKLFANRSEIKLFSKTISIFYELPMGESGEVVSQRVSPGKGDKAGRARFSCTCLVIDDFYVRPSIALYAVDPDSGNEVEIAKKVVPQGKITISCEDPRANMEYYFKLTCHNRGTLVLQNIIFDVLELIKKFCKRTDLLSTQDVFFPDEVEDIVFVAVGKEPALELDMSDVCPNGESLISIYIDTHENGFLNVDYRTSFDDQYGGAKTIIRKLTKGQNKVEIDLRLTSVSSLRLVFKNLVSRIVVRAIEVHVHPPAYEVQKLQTQQLPAISFIIPCFNHGEYLRETLASIQKIDPSIEYEIIIVNDGSTALDTISILEEIRQERHPRLTIVDQENQGLGAARNNAIAIASGKYIFPVDADNTINPETIPHVLDAFDTDKEIGVVYGHSKFFGYEPKIKELLQGNPGVLDNIHIVPQFNLRRHFYLNKIDACAFFRRDIWKEVGGYKTDMIGYQDWDFWTSIAALEKYKFYHTDKVLFNYRVSEISMVSNSVLHHEDIKNVIIKNNLSSYKKEYENLLYENLKGITKGRRDLGIEHLPEIFEDSTFVESEKDHFLMTEGPLLSVIVPVYNKAKFLRIRFETIFQQTYRNIEVIILDNCSTDGSLDVIKIYVEKYKEKYKIKTRYNRENNNSVFKQWQAGLEMAEGEYIWIAEADDFSRLDFASCLMNEFISNPKIGIAYCQSNFVDDADSVFGNHFENLEALDRIRWSGSFQMDGLEFCRYYLSVFNVIPNASAVIFRKQLMQGIDWSKVLTFKVCGDWYVWSMLVKDSSIAFCSESMNYFRFNSMTVRSEVYKHVYYLFEKLDAYSEIYSYTVPSQNTRDKAFNDMIEKIKFVGLNNRDSLVQSMPKILYKCSALFGTKVIALDW